MKMIRENQIQSLMLIINQEIRIHHCLIRTQMILDQKKVEKETQMVHPLGKRANEAENAEVRKDVDHQEEEDQLTCLEEVESISEDMSRRVLVQVDTVIAQLKNEVMLILKDLKRRRVA